MIAYTTIGTADIEKAKAFYLALLKDMGGSLIMDIGRLAAFGAPSGGPSGMSPTGSPVTPMQPISSGN